MYAKPNDTLQNELKELIAIYAMLPHEERAIILSNANILRIRQEILKSQQQDKPA